MADGLNRQKITLSCTIAISHSGRYCFCGYKLLQLSGYSNGYAPTVGDFNCTESYIKGTHTTIYETTTN